MPFARQILTRSALVFALSGCLFGCDDDTAATGANDASADIGVQGMLPGTNPDVAATSGVTDAASGHDAPANAGPDVAVQNNEFSWHIDPMEIVLQRGTCRTVSVHVQRRSDYNGPITLGVAGGAEKVGFSANPIERDASLGSFVLTTAANAPAVNAAPLIVGATGDKTHLRLTVAITVADTAPVTDGGVLEPAGVDGSVFDEPTCRLIVGALGI
ncbi:MAG: hypothetical protein SGI86_13255 [Deltaproteobacteria bacterium]|nr:hypothetical protein [Deltaproteobacteria bacterium]